MSTVAAPRQVVPAEWQELLNDAVREAQAGDPRLGVESFLKIRDKQQQGMVGFTFKPTQEEAYPLIFDGHFFDPAYPPVDIDVLKSRQVLISALVSYCLFWMRCCAPLSCFCGVPVEGDEVHKQALQYDNDAWLSLPQWVKQELRIVRGDAYRAPPGMDAPQLSWNNEQHDIAFLDAQGVYQGKSSMVFRASTIRDAGTGGNYDIKWFNDAGKYAALTEEDFYVSLRRASHALTRSIWEASPKGKIHSETGEPKFFYTLFETFRAQNSPTKRLIVMEWFRNPDYETEPEGDLAYTNDPSLYGDEPFVVGLIERAYPGITAQQIARKMAWRRREIEEYVTAAKGSRARGLSKFKQENLETVSDCWDDAALGVFDPGELTILEQAVRHPIRTPRPQGGLQTRIFFEPQTGDYYVSFMDIAGARTGGDLTVCCVMSCREARVVAEFFGNGSQEEAVRQHWELMWRYNKGLINWETNGLGQTYGQVYLAKCKELDLPASRHLYRRGLRRNNVGKLKETVDSAAYETRDWGWYQTGASKEELVSSLQGDIDNGVIKFVPAETLTALRSFDPNNKKHHTADRVMSLMGCNQMRRDFAFRVKGAVVQITNYRHREGRHARRLAGATSEVGVRGYK